MTDIESLLQNNKNLAKLLGATKRQLKESMDGENVALRRIRILENTITTLRKQLETSRSRTLPRRRAYRPRVRPPSPSLPVEPDWLTSLPAEETDMEKQTMDVMWTPEYFDGLPDGK